MTYNIHPIFVHFPIALLFIYSVIKILPFKKWIPSVSWQQIERFLLVFGILGSFASLATGETAENLARANRQLVEVHSTFASISTFIYCVLLFGEIIFILNNSYQSLIKIEKVKNLSIKLEKLIFNPFVSKSLALLGFIAISVTGLLGGVIVYGVSADPVAPIVLKLLGINL